MMKDFKILTNGLWHFGYLDHVREEMMEPLMDVFRLPAQGVENDLGGRAKVKRCHIDELGDLVLKQYYRGGALRHVNKQTYLRWGKSRSQLEFEYLLRAQNAGIATPNPVAFIVYGKLFYRAALVLEEIPGAQTLVEISRNPGEKTKAFMAKVHTGIELLVKARIHHVDLHPGNILVSGEEEVYFIDFDKAYTWSGDASSLKSRYITRWNRSITKYGLKSWLLL